MNWMGMAEFLLAYGVDINQQTRWVSLETCLPLAMPVLLHNAVYSVLCAFLHTLAQLCVQLMCCIKQPT